jgi:SH3 domain-containing YSC84-like protein 1
MNFLGRSVVIMVCCSLSPTFDVCVAGPASASTRTRNDPQNPPVDPNQPGGPQIESAGKVLNELLDSPEGIPQSILDRAYCIVLVPSVSKAGFVVGTNDGRGVMTCRSGASFDGPWGPPALMRLEGGSFNLQLGAQATDFVLLLMNSQAVRTIVSGKLKLGGDASAAAGPVGRDASAGTDATLRAEILSYSRSRGLFAGISLEGSTLRPDENANNNLYGEAISAEAIVLKDAVKPPPSARLLLRTVNRKSPHLLR